MTKLTPNSQYEFVQIEGRDNIRHWVHNKDFSVHINDRVVISDKKGVIAFVRVIRRSRDKPIKGTPIWRIIATDNQFPVAENTQVVACDHVAPAPDSISLIKHELAVAKDKTANTLARIEKLQGLINHG